IHEEAAFRTGAVSDADGAFVLDGLLPQAHRLGVLDAATLQCAAFGPFADGATDVVLTVGAPADLQPEWSGPVIDAAGRPIAGAVVRTSLWSSLRGLGSAVLLANSFVAGADGRVVVPAQCSDGVTVTVEAQGCVTLALARSELHGPALQLGRVAYMRYLGR